MSLFMDNLNSNKRKIKIKGNIPQIHFLAVCVITVNSNKKNERSGSNGAC